MSPTTTRWAWKAPTVADPLMTLNLEQLAPHLDGDFEVYNVRDDFGARGDGVTNDSEAIQDAIDAAYESASYDKGGGIVFLPRGIYICNIEIKKYVVLQGAGWGTWLAPPPASSTAVISGSGNTPFRCAMRGFAINGRAGHLFSGEHFYDAGGTTYATSRAIDFDIAYNNLDLAPTIENIWLYDCYEGIKLGDACRETWINKVMSERTTKFALHNDCTDTMVSDCQFGSNGDGVIDTGFNNAYSNVKSWYNHGTSGTYVGSGNGFYFAGERNRATGCETQDFAGAGIYLDSANETTITGHQIGGDLGSTASAIYLANDATDNRISATVTGADLTGIRYGLTVSGAGTVRNSVDLDVFPDGKGGTFSYYNEVSSGVIATNAISFGRARVRVRNDAAISVNDVTNTALTFNAERRDSEAMHSTSSNTSRLTAVRPGWYTISGHVQWEASAGGTVRRLGIVVNATLFYGVQSSPPLGAATVVNQSVETKSWLAAGNYVELYAYQDSGGALNVNSTVAYSPEFEMSCE